MTTLCLQATHFFGNLNCAISGYLRTTAWYHLSLPAITFQPTGNLYPSQSRSECSPLSDVNVLQDDSFDNLGKDVSLAFIFIQVELVRITDINNETSRFIISGILEYLDWSNPTVRCFGRHVQSNSKKSKKIVIDKRRKEDKKKIKEEQEDGNRLCSNKVF